MKRSIVLILVLLTGACSQVGEIKKSIDRTSFELSGGTLFSSPATVTIKEIHFDTGKLVGLPIILEATVVEFGAHDTHVIVDDGTGRMLVVMTALSESDQYFQDSVRRPVRVLGSIERGKKGLPFVQAAAIQRLAVEP